MVPALAALNTSSPTYLAALISAASESIQKYCHRQFVLASFSEYYNGGIYNNAPFRLREFPVTAITRFAGWPQAAIQIINTDTTTNQRATVQVLATLDVVLYRVASAVPHTDTILAATAITIGGLATAINALGGGWQATVQTESQTGDFAKWPQTDLRPLQGAVTAFSSGAWLEIFTEDYSPYVGWGGNWAGDGNGGDPGPWTGNTYGWRLDSESGEVYGHFPRGQQNIRVDYSAGYATIPASIQQAACDLIVWQYQQSLINRTFDSVKLGNSAVKFADATQWPSSITAALARWVAFDKVVIR
jgi:hypothetical protein